MQIHRQDGDNIQIEGVSNMKCPYQTRIIHQPERVCKNGDIKVNAEDRTIFGECYKDECPLYSSLSFSLNNEKVCLRAKAEGSKR